MKAPIWVSACALRRRCSASSCGSLSCPTSLSRRWWRKPPIRLLRSYSLVRGNPPDLVLSGINRGVDLGIETAFSGTVGAAMTAMLLGLPAIALSQAFSDREAVPWDTARAHAPAVIRRLWPVISGTPACPNVNFPDTPAGRAGSLTLTRQGVGLVQGIEVNSRTDLRGGE